MPRTARVVAAGVPHHLTQRGNNRQDIFLLDHDRRAYLELLDEACRDAGIRLLGYCLMTNHVHLVAVPVTPGSFARGLRRAHSRYAQQFNRRYRRSGHLWQNRYFSCPLGGGHLLAALAYIDLNPVRAGLVGEAREYPWSSTEAHEAGGGDERIDWGLWREVRGSQNWAGVLAGGAPPGFGERLSRATQAGAPLDEIRGNPALVSRPGHEGRGGAYNCSANENIGR